MLDPDLWDARRRSAADVPRLQGAVEVALKQHRGGEVITFAACSEHNIIMTMGDPLRFARMRECPDCIKTAHLVCETCDEDWPCKPYRDITAELLREVSAVGPEVTPEFRQQAAALMDRNDGLMRRLAGTEEVPADGS